MHKTIEHTCSSNNSLCQNVHVNGDEIKRDRNLGEGLGCERLAVSFPLNGAVVWEVAEDGRKGANRLVFEEGDYNGIYTSLDARHIRNIIPCAFVRCWSDHIIRHVLTTEDFSLHPKVFLPCDQKICLWRAVGI